MDFKRQLPVKIRSPRLRIRMHPWQKCSQNNKKKVSIMIWKNINYSAAPRLPKKRIRDCELKFGVDWTSNWCQYIRRTRRTCTRPRAYRTMPRRTFKMPKNSSARAVKPEIQIFRPRCRKKRILWSRVMPPWAIWGRPKRRGRRICRIVEWKRDRIWMWPNLAGKSHRATAASAVMQ